MGLIQQTDNLTDPLVFPPPGCHYFYSKAGGYFAMDSTGAVVGPFTGGSGPPTGPAGGSLAGTYPNPSIAPGAVGSPELAALAVTAGKIDAGAVGTTELANVAVTNAKIANSAVQTAQIANFAVTNPKIAPASVGPLKLINPVGMNKLVFSNTAATWAFDYAPRIQFGVDPAGPFTPRISILGDRGTATDPINPRILNSSAADANLGYLERSLGYEAKVGVDLATLASPPTSVDCTNTLFITISLPDSRLYPRGQELVFYVESTSGPVLIPVAGSIPPYTSIVGPDPVAPQGLLPGTGCRFISFGDGWRLIGTSENRLTTSAVIPMADGMNERPNLATSKYGWVLTGGNISRQWEGDLPNRYLFFPVRLKSGSTITRVDVLLQHNTAAPVTPMAVNIGGSTGLDFVTPSIGVNAIAASANAVANNSLQTVSLTGLSIQIDNSAEFWTIGIVSSSGAASGTEDTVLGVLLTYYEP